MSKIANLTRTEGVLSGAVVCPYCDADISFTEGTNGTAIVIRSGINQNTELKTGNKFTEERIGFELNVECDTCGFIVRSIGELVNRI